MSTRHAPEAALPPGLPDPAVLARLAGEFLAALPGQPAGLSLPPGSTGPSTPAAAPLGALPPGSNLLPQSPQTLASAAASVPSLQPHASAGNGVPDLLLQAASGYDGRLGSPVLAVPQAASAGPPSSAHFYFLEHVPQLPASAHPPFDVNAVRRDFPILRERVNGRPLVWFDNAATTHKPQGVIDRLAHFYAHENSNIHRAAHALAARATDAYEGARETVRRFIGASSVDEIVFVRGTTEAINLVAKTWGAKHVGAGDEIIVTHLEHHANIVPWQQLAAEKGAKIRVIPVDDSGQVILQEFQRLLNDRTKLVAVTQVSNALGTVVPVGDIVDIAHRAGVRTLVDGAQSVSHLRVDMRALDTDFFVFSGHKIFGPTGIGVLYGKREVLEDMPPWQGGGNMIRDVTFERTVYHGPPTRFEAGTGNIADAVGLGAALEYVERIGIEAIGRYEQALLDYATGLLKPIPGVRLVGTARDKASVLSFVLDGHSTDEVGQALNAEGIAVRTGHHCAQPILRRFGLEATVRPSLAFYNTCEEVDRFIAVIRQLSTRRGGRA
jgi:cysteine desulfurase/selenocysteine lyase